MEIFTDFNPTLTQAKQRLTMQIGLSLFIIVCVYSFSGFLFWFLPFQRSQGYSIVLACPCRFPMLTWPVHDMPKHSHVYWI